MMFGLGLAVGLFVGCMVGMAIMSLMFIARNDDAEIMDNAEFAEVKKKGGHK